RMLGKEVKDRGQDLHSLRKGTIDLEWLRDEIAQIEEVTKAIGRQKQALEVEIEAPQRVKLLEEAIVVEAGGQQRRVRGGAMAGLRVFGLAVFGVTFWEFRRRRTHRCDEVARG